MSKPLAIVIGFVGKLPYAGMSVYSLHHILGLQDLGYRVHYLERQNEPNQCYDPAAGRMTDDPSYGLGYLRHELARAGLGENDFSFIDRTDQCHGSGWKPLRDALDHADFLLDLESPTWFDELERCPRRAFIDGDPLFIQVDMMNPESVTSQAVAHYPVLFTYGTRIGASDCCMPLNGRSWLPARPVIATRMWEPVPATPGLPVTALMQWKAGNNIHLDGRTYGHKDREFDRFIDLPRKSSRTFALAVGGNAPRQELSEYGWRFVDPMASTRSIESYKEFINGSYAELGIAKNAYVDSKCGWFSDRSLCYIASGRPVLHQNTGFTDWLPARQGVLPFSTAEQVLEGLHALELDYAHHSAAARKIAEEHFEASTVLRKMIDQAGFA